jgi:8-oxo-dGTP pyrophosphatase MutT (NUDIX family)
MKDESVPPQKPSKEAEAQPWPKPIPRGKKVAYGGVIFDRNGRVLLREPRNHWDDYVWTFAKGRPDPHESPAVTALREVQEETGVKAAILEPIPGEFLGGTTLNRYFLMMPDGPVQPFPPMAPETVSVCWAHPEEARGLIKQTINKEGRDRDLAVLEAALEAWAILRK